MQFNERFRINPNVFPFLLLIFVRMLFRKNNMMRIRKFIYMILIVAAIGAISGCKKDKKDTPKKPSLSGSVKFHVPEYVLPKEKISTDLIKKAKHPKDGNIGYIWKVNATDFNRDTVKRDTDPADKATKYEFNAPNELGSFTIFCTAYSKGYYDLSSSRTFIVVSPDSSITGITSEKEFKKFIDKRDQIEYKYVEIGNKAWFAENLAYSELGIAYRNSEAMSNVFGRYYNFEDAKQACPEGWRLPTEEDWKSLEESANNKCGDLMAKAEFNGNKIWEFWPEVDINNKTGFSALLLGYGIISENAANFKGYKDYASFWTATEDKTNAERGLYKYFYVKTPTIMTGQGDKKSYYAPVRCVRDL